MGVPQDKGTLHTRGTRALSNDYLEGQGDLVSRLITHITQVISPFIPIINLLTKSPRPPKYGDYYKAFLYSASFGKPLFLAEPQPWNIKSAKHRASSRHRDFHTMGLFSPLLATAPNI